jgi:hypothetical protein
MVVGRWCWCCEVGEARAGGATKKLKPIEKSKNAMRECGGGSLKEKGWKVWAWEA